MVLVLLLLFKEEPKVLENQLSKAELKSWQQWLKETLEAKSVTRLTLRIAKKLSAVSQYQP